MIKAGYEQLVEKIAKGAALTIEEVERRVDAKRAKLSGLISKEGAAQIVAAELGVNFDRQKVKISELLTGMRKISVVGKVINVYPVRTFKKNDMDNKVATLMIADDSSSVRVVLWDTNHISLVESSEIKEGSVVEIKDAAVRSGELHLSNISSIKPVNQTIENVVIRENFEENTIEKIQPNVGAVIRAVIVQMFEPRFFAVCPECNIKLTNENDKFVCSIHNIVIPKFKAIGTLIIDDGTESIRAVFFDEVSRKLFEVDDSEQLRNTEFALKKRDELLGKEFLFFGKARQNKVFGGTEFIVSEITEINVKELIKKLSR